MTIAAAWVRKVNQCEELVFISDSRLCGGHRWDECPKLIELPGSNSALAFAGDTDYAYPMMIQMKYAMSGYRRIETRAMDIADINGHLLNHANHLLTSVYDLADPNFAPDNEFIFGGYSWTEKRFRLWRYFYSIHNHALIKSGKSYHILKNVKGDIVIIGDQRENFKRILRKTLVEKYGANLESASDISLDMEPFETLCKMLWKTDKCATIGGAPQMIKVYQYLNTCPVGVYWPHKTEDFANRTMLGRKMFDYEDTAYWFIDPDTLKTNPCIKTPDNTANT